MIEKYTQQDLESLQNTFKEVAAEDPSSAVGYALALDVVRNNLEEPTQNLDQATESEQNIV